MRSEYCGLMSRKQLGQTVRLHGWVHRRRDHGGVIFIDLRDREGIVQIVCDPTGFPVAVSDVEPGSVHDISAARATGFLGALYAAAALLGLPTLADKGYDGAGAGVHTPAKGAHLAPDTAARNQLIRSLRAEGERGMALLKTSWKALRHIRLCPQRIGAITAAALVLTSAERPIR